MSTVKSPKDHVLAEMYRLVYLIRVLEERVAHTYHTDKIKSPVHLSVGQEAPSVGVCLALRRGDIVFGTYRGHALYLAKGGNLNRMVAELYGKSTGCCRGKGGSMHLSDRSVGMMGTSAIVATSIPHAVGFALAEKMSGRDTVVTVFFGDGATEEGVYYESLNFASLMKLPVVFVCENNGYAIHTPWQKRMASPNYCDRATAFGVPARRIGANDILGIYGAALDLVEEARLEGPRFLEVETYRWLEHVGPAEDWNLGYRKREEAEVWLASDQLTRLAELIPDALGQSIRARCDIDLDTAFRFAEESPYPTEMELYEHVFR